MEALSAKEAAQKWGTHLRVVQGWCQQGLIPGAKKCGTAWLIPAEAQKPEALRRAYAQEKQAAAPYLRCVLLSAVVPMPPGEPEGALPALPDESQRAQYRAELAYLRGDFAAVKAYYAGVTPEDATYLCAANIAICAAMSTRDYPLFQQISAEVKQAEQTSRPGAEAAPLLGVLAAVCMNAPQMAPEWLKSGDFSGWSAEARPMLAFMRVKYLQSVKEHSGVLAAAQTARALLMQGEGVTLVDIYLTCFCACGCYALGRMEECRAYLAQSVALCEPRGFVAPLGEYTTWVGGQLEIALKRCAPSFEKAVKAHIEKTLKNWLFFHNEFARDNASLILTPREYQLAVLLKEGKTYQQAAQQLCLSVGRTRNLITILYSKLGISQKAEIKKYVY